MTIFTGGGGISAAQLAGGTLPASLTAITNTGLALDLPSIASWVALFEANRLTGLSDADPVSTWTDASGNARNATQTLTKRPTFKAAASGINSQPIVRFDGVNDSMHTAAGGASLGGDWYMCCVAKLANLTQYMWLLHFGDQDTAKRQRGLLFMDDSNRIVFNNAFDSNLDGPVLVAGTAYFIECSSVSGQVSLFVNGVKLATAALSFLAFTSAILSLGSGADDSAPFAGDMALAGFIGSAPTAETLNRIRGYVEVTYGIAVAGGGSNFLAYHNSAGLSVRSSLYDNGTDIGFYGRTLYGVSTSGADHYLATSSVGHDVLKMQNTNAEGFSTVFGVGHDVDSLGVSSYGAAFGWGNTSASPQVFRNVAYMEAYDSGSATAKAARIIQTTTDGNFRRIDVEPGGDIVFYRRDAAYPSETKIMTLKASGVLNIQAAPTSSAGLSSGDVWSDSNTLKIV